MSNNEVTLFGYIKQIFTYETTDFTTLFLTISVYSHKNRATGKNVYDNIKAQMSQNTTIDAEPNSRTAVSQTIFEYLKNNVAEGTPITIRGTLKSNDQIYLEGSWHNFRNLTPALQEEYAALSKEDLILRKETYVNIDYATVSNRPAYTGNRSNGYNQYNTHVQPENTAEPAEEPENQGEMIEEGNDYGGYYMDMSFELPDAKPENKPTGDSHMTVSDNDIDNLPF